MKRTLLLLLLVMLTIGLIGCGQANEPNDETGQQPNDIQEEVNHEGHEAENDEEEINEENNEVVNEEDDDELPLDEEVSDVEEPDEADEPAYTGDPIIVDGYDITAAVTGTPLKEAFADYFKMGVALNGSSPSNDTVQSAAMREIIKHQFNSIVYSNLMKPAYFLDQRASIDNFRNGNDEPAVKFNDAIAGLEFAKENDIQMRGHVLIWHTQTPDWFFKEGYQGTGALVDRETMLARMESYIKQVLEFMQTEYPGVIYAWDVVNEAVEVVGGHYETETGLNIRTKHGNNQDNLWYVTIGVDYVEKGFEFARKYADPDVKLFYNDYNTFQPQKTSKIYDLVSGLKEKGLIDGIGMQGHMNLSYPGIKFGNHNWRAAIEKFAELGLEIHVTELTINSENNDAASMERQANRYKDLFELFVELDTASGGPANITSVTVFGLMDEYLFYPNDKQYSRLFDGKLQPKLSFQSIMSVVK